MATEESLACQITSPFHNKVVFANEIKKIALQKQPIFLLNGEVIWQASDTPLTKELHAGTYVGLTYFERLVVWNVRKVKKCKCKIDWYQRTLTSGGGSITVLLVRIQQL